MARLDTTRSPQKPSAQPTQMNQTTAAKPPARPAPIITDYASL
ncbi:hypothetical protein SAMN04488523_102148 [Sulfitobacter brevis]|uniref:Uncharacterized protein n=1 Tax=Sulfitobacter brevis TaxID=74348 RepID=A0A1I1UJV4_9RHOB|nr:hypothetical protein [Sulfitobacter brevis]SFD71037.1 hypothetical protein SAMN04488523_102148 [Sulfitobacter brevis]